MRKQFVRSLTFKLSVLIALITLAACDTGVTSDLSDSEEAPQMITSKTNEGGEIAVLVERALGDGITEIDSARTDRSRLYRLADGTYALYLHGGQASRASSEENNDIATNGTEFSNSPVCVGTVRYDFSGTKYREDIHCNLGYNPDWDTDYDDETHRSSLTFEGLSSIPNYSTIYRVEMDWNISDPFGEGPNGEESPQQERSGEVEIREFVGDLPEPPVFPGGDEDHFDGVGDGALYHTFSIPESDIGSKVFDSTTDRIVKDVEEATQNGEDEFTVGFKAKVESSSGALGKVVEGGTGLIVFFTERPTIPELSSPSDGAEVPSDDGSVTLDWETSDGDPRPEYKVQLDESSSFSSPDQKTTSGSSASYSGLDIGGTYYWRVKAMNSVGESDWSEVRSFTLVEPPLVAYVYGPRIIRSGNSNNWYTSVSGGDSPYQYQWYYRYENGPWYEASGENESSFTWSFGNPGPGNRDAAVRVEVIDSDGEKTTATRDLTVLPESDCDGPTVKEGDSTGVNIPTC